MLFKQKLLQQVLWNKKVSLKEQGHKFFPEINILYNFSRIHHRSLVIMDVYNKCCETNTVPLTYRSLQALPSKNNTVIEKMDDRKWCRHITGFFQYMHAWNQGGIIISTYDFSLLQFLFWKNTVNSKELTQYLWKYWWL